MGHAARRHISVREPIILYAPLYTLYTPSLPYLHLCTHVIHVKYTINTPYYTPNTPLNTLYTPYIHHYSYIGQREVPEPGPLGVGA